MFGPNETYLQSLKLVARRLIQWPINKYELSDAFDAFKTILYFMIALIIRPILVVLLPISAPLLTLIFRYDNRKKLERLEEHRKKMLESRWPNQKIVIERRERGWEK